MARHTIEVYAKHVLNMEYTMAYLDGLEPGIELKKQCDKCGFKSPHQEVFRVYHVDENLDNCRHTNLKTVCANCRTVLSKEGIKWKQGDLVADY